MTRLPVLDPWFGIMTLDDARMGAMDRRQALRLDGAVLRLRYAHAAEGVLRMVEVVEGNPHQLPLEMYTALDTI